MFRTPEPFITPKTGRESETESQRLYGWQRHPLAHNQSGDRSASQTQDHVPKGCTIHPAALHIPSASDVRSQAQQDRASGDARERSRRSWIHHKPEFIFRVPSDWDVADEGRVWQHGPEVGGLFRDWHEVLQQQQNPDARVLLSCK